MNRSPVRMDLAAFFTPSEVENIQWRNGRFVWTGRWAWLRNLMARFA